MSHMRNHALHIALQRCIDRAHGHIEDGSTRSAQAELEMVSELAQAMFEHCHNHIQALITIKESFKDGRLQTAQKVKHTLDVLDSINPPL